LAPIYGSGTSLQPRIARPNKFKLHFIVGAPQNRALLPAYETAKVILAEVLHDNEDLDLRLICRRRNNAISSKAYNSNFNPAITS
jgi:hypothetical protein